MAVKPVPDGFNTVTPHLIVKDGAKAVSFYKQAFGAEERYAMKDPTGKVMHAEVKIGDSIIMLADEYPEYGSKSAATIGDSPVTVMLYVEDADKVFNRAVEAGAKVTMPLENMFWGDRYGKLIDPFGHHWAIATHVKDVSPEEMEKAAAKMFAS